MDNDVNLDSLIHIGDLDEIELSKYSKEFLEKLAEFLGFKFDDLFIDS